MVRLIHHPEGQPGRRQGGPTEIESRGAHWKKTELGAQTKCLKHTHASSGGPLKSLLYPTCIKSGTKELMHSEQLKIPAHHGRASGGPLLCEESIGPNMHQIRNKRTDAFRAINYPSPCSRNGVTMCVTLDTYIAT